MNNGGSTRQCGFPGRPRNGSSSTSSRISRPGDTVHYSCKPGYTLFGEEERVCLDSGIWAGRQPLCELNLAREKTALLSATLWNYRASLAVDGNPDTCSFTPRTSEQRWWQVDLSTDHHVGSVALIINKDSYQEFTVFVIQLLSKSEALYKPCDTFKGRFQNPQILFNCNKGLGHRGRYVYIRDDRRDVDRFVLCEVEVFAYRDENICGEPEEPIAGHVTVGLDAMAIYSCDPGYRLLSEPNRTCERDGHWIGHAPQCEAITCGPPQQLPNMDVELANQSTLWNAVAIYNCKAGYSFTAGIIQTSVTCLSSGVWEKTNITCIPDDDHHSPVQLTGKDWSPHPPHSDNEGQSRNTITPTIIFIGIICALLLIILIVLGIVLVRRFQSKKSTRATPQSSTNDLIISNAKDGVYNDVRAPGFQMVVAVQPQHSPPAREESPANNTIPYFTRNHEPNCYDTLYSFPSVSSYNSTVITDIEQDSNYARTKHGDADGEDMKLRDMAQEKPCQVLNIGYESVHIHSECEHPLNGAEYKTIRSLQQMGTESSFELVQPNGSIQNLGKSKVKIRRSIPSALKYFLQPTPKSTETELHEGVVSAEIMALYAQVDKSKKRKYRAETLNTIDGTHVSANHICNQTGTECECIQHPISDIVRFSQDSCNPGVWNGNSKDCSASTLKVISPVGRPLPPIPSIHFIPAAQAVEPQSQTLESAQL